MSFRSIVGLYLVTAAVTVASQADDLLNAGLSAARERKWTAARDVLLEGKSVAPRDVRFPLELAGVSYRLEDRPEAKRYLHLALRIDPVNAYGNDFLAHLYYLEGNLPAALRYWNRVGKPRIRRVMLDTNAAVTPGLLHRAVSISELSVLSENDLRNARQNLDRLDAFGAYRVDLLARDHQQFDVEVKTMDRSTPGVGWLNHLARAGSGLPYQTLFFDLDNIGRSATNLTSIVRWDPDKRLIAGSISGPLIGRPKWRYLVAVDFRQELWDLTSARLFPGRSDNLPLRRTAISAGVETGLTSRLTWTNAATFSVREFGNIVAAPDALFADGPGLKQSTSLRYRLIDNPERRLTLDISGGGQVGAQYGNLRTQFAQFQSGAGFRWIMDGRKNFELGSVTRAAKSIGQMPFDEYAMLGMERDNDLWLRGHVGTRDGRKGAAPLGSDYILIGNDLKRTVYKNAFLHWSAGPLLDIGRVSERTGAFGSKGWLVDTGVESQWRFLGGATFVLTYGYDTRSGNSVVYTAIRRR